MNTRNEFEDINKNSNKFSEHNNDAPSGLRTKTTKIIQPEKYNWHQKRQIY